MPKLKPLSFVAHAHRAGEGVGVCEEGGEHSPRGLESRCQLTASKILGSTVHDDIGAPLEGVLRTRRA